MLFLWHDIVYKSMSGGARKVKFAWPWIENCDILFSEPKVMQVLVTTVLLLLAALPAVLSLQLREEWRDTEMLKQSLPEEINKEIQQIARHGCGNLQWMLFRH